MAMKDITDEQVCRVVRDRDPANELVPVTIPARLSMLTGQPEKVARRCVERAGDRGLIEWGTSPNYPWLTEAGKALLESAPKGQPAVGEAEYESFLVSNNLQRQREWLARKSGR